MKKIVLVWPCAIIIFVLILIAYAAFSPYEENIEEQPQKPFSMYDWRYGTVNGYIGVADVCGKNTRDDNMFLHIRKIDKSQEIWIKCDDDYDLKWRVGYERITYSLKFTSDDYKHSFTSSCTCIHNENGNVLNVDYPQDILSLLAKQCLFNVKILRMGTEYDDFTFSTTEPLIL